MTPKKKEEEKKITFHIAQEKTDKRNEMYENTLNNIHAMSVFTVKNYGRAGYQIKLLEQILSELKKLNKGKK
jgi:hypothetical protein